MPIIFLRELPANLTTYEPQREVVDGQQRLRTLISFISPAALPDYDPERDVFTVRTSHNRDIAGKTFNEIPANTRQTILDYQFSVHVFPADTDDRDILQIFARMNSTGVKLNHQELRNAEFFGEFKTLMYLLATEQLNRWRTWGLFSEYALARMEEVELTSELVLYMLRGVSGLSQPALTKLYGDYDEVFDGSDEIAKRFRFVMDFVDDSFPGKEIQQLGLNRKIVFYSLFVTIYHAAYSDTGIMNSTRPKSIDPSLLKWVRKAAEKINSGSAPVEVVDAAKRHTTDVGSRQRVVGYLGKPSS